MLKLLICAWLTATIAVAQTSPKAARPGEASSAKPASGATASAKPATGSAALAPATTKLSSSTAPSRSLPEHPLGTKLKNNTSLNPNYEKEKKATGRGTKREYTPRRTASGARADTMNQRRKP